MGYRSDIAIACAFPTDQQAVAYVTKQRMLIPRVEGVDVWKDMLKDNLYVYHPKPYTDQQEREWTCTTIYSIFEGLKWYEGYQDVQAIQKFYKEAENHGGAWIEVTVGEDNVCGENSGYDEKVKGAGHCIDCLTSDFQTTSNLYTPDTYAESTQRFNNFIKEAKHNEEVRQQGVDNATKNITSNIS